MAKGNSRRCRIASRHCKPTAYLLQTKYSAAAKMKPKKSSKKYENKDWKDATCSVCMEYPHNAVLLLCSSHEKGCHPYMCGTSFCFSNCLEQYRKAYSKVMSSSSNGVHNHDSLDSPATDHHFSSSSDDKLEVTELVCPLCRGQVKGWTVVKPAREHLNRKKRCCMQDDCSFIGTYKELRRHVKAEHPSAKPCEVDPLLEQKWSRLEGEREREDVISTITSSIPRAVVIGDYVIEGSPHSFASDDKDAAAFNGGGLDQNWMNLLLFLQTIGSPAGGGGVLNTGNRRESNRTLEEHTVDNSGSGSGTDRSFGYFEEESESVAEADNDYHDVSLASRLRCHGRVLLGRSGQRRRRRESRYQGW